MLLEGLPKSLDLGIGGREDMERTVGCQSLRGGGRPLVQSRRHDVPLHNVILIIIGAHLCSVGDLDLVGSEPFWSDPDPINRPDPTIKSHKTRKKSKKLKTVL